MSERLKTDRIEDFREAAKMLDDAGGSSMISLKCQLDRNPPICNINTNLDVSAMAELPNSGIMVLLIVATQAGRFLESKGWKVNY